MAITTIDNLTEKTTAVGENDLLLIAEKNGNIYTTKSIKANAVGGGGADDFVITFTVGESSVSSNKTVAEIITAYQSGNNIKGVYEIDGITFFVNLTGIMISVEMNYLIFYGYQSEGTSREIIGMSSGGNEMWTTTERSFN